MSVDSSTWTEPKCPECGVRLPRSSQLDDSHWECRRCRDVFEPWEVFDL